MKIKLDRNDVLFSKMVRERDGKCIFCSRRPPEYVMTCSHFWGRGDKTHRFDPLNCDTLCFSCHMTHEGNKQGFYRDWKIKQLGEKKYQEMERAHYQKTKKYGKHEKEILYQVLKGQYERGDHLKKDWEVLW